MKKGILLVVATMLFTMIGARAQSDFTALTAAYNNGTNVLFTYQANRTDVLMWRVQVSHSSAFTSVSTPSVWKATSSVGIRTDTLAPVFTDSAFYRVESQHFDTTIFAWVTDTSNYVSMSVPIVTTDTARLIATSAVNDHGRHVNYQFYYSNVSGDTLTIFSQIFRSSDSSMITELEFDNMAHSGIVDTGYTVPTAGNYYIVLWGFGRHGVWLTANTIAVTVTNVSLVSYISAQEQNLPGVVRLVSMSGKIFGPYNYSFNDLYKISFAKDLPMGDYGLQFISNDGAFMHTEKIFVH